MLAAHAALDYVSEIAATLSHAAPDWSGEQRSALDDRGAICPTFCTACSAAIGSSRPDTPSMVRR